MGTAETTARKLRGRPFQKGISANPSGRPIGSRNRTTMIAAELLAGEAEALTRKVIEKAKAGDVACLRLCMDRLMAPMRDGPIRIQLLPMEVAADAARAMGCVLQAVASGNLTPLEGKDVASLIETWARAFETTEIERRLQALEQRSCGKG